jgi:hypothetical protein
MPDLRYSSAQGSSLLAASILGLAPGLYASLLRRLRPHSLGKAVTVSSYEFQVQT